MSCNVATFVCRRQLATDGLACRTAFVSRGFSAAALAAAGNDGMPVGALPLHRKDLVAHFGCVNAVEFSPSNSDGAYQSPYLMASGGDDRRVLIWTADSLLSTTSTSPLCLCAKHNSNIFCLAFSDSLDNSKALLFSGGNDEQVIVHDLQTAKALDVFFHDEPVYGLSVQPMSGGQTFASASSDGFLRLFDLRQPARDEAVTIAEFQKAFHSVVFNPVEARLLAAANQKRGVGLWDVRKPKCSVIEYGNISGRPQTAMSVQFNSKGDRLLALRRKMPPVLFKIDSPVAETEFDHEGYYNSCTMKSCCFAGMNDEFVVSGSDDFNIYAWKIPDCGDESRWVNRAHFVLRGHRSIVNQVRFSRRLCAIASAGVEKAVKLWSPLPLSGAGDQGEGRHHRLGRKMYSREGYIRMVLNSGSYMSHDYSTESTEENPRMNAFFDWLVQRDIEGDRSSADDDSDDSAPPTDSSFSSLDDEDRDAETDEPGGVQRSEFRGIRLRASGGNSLRTGTANDSGSYRSAGGATSRMASLDEESEDEDDEDENGADGETPAPRSNLRIAELIARKRCHVISRHRRQTKRTRVDSAFIRSSLLKARKLLRIEAPSSSDADANANAPSDAPSEESNDADANAPSEPDPPLPAALQPVASPVLDSEEEEAMKREILVALDQREAEEEVAADSDDGAIIAGSGREQPQQQQQQTASGRTTRKWRGRNYRRPSNE